MLAIQLTSKSSRAKKKKEIAQRMASLKQKHLVWDKAQGCVGCMDY
jgi:hypothetical protein